jgi:GTPase SAR1 family protein
MTPTLAPLRYRGSAADVVVYSGRDRHSFDSVPAWLRHYRSGNRQANPLILVGNKIDPGAALAATDGRELARRERLAFVETSAKEGTGVEALLDALALTLWGCPPPQPSAVQFPR